MNTKVNTTKCTSIVDTIVQYGVAHSCTIPDNEGSDIRAVKTTSGKVLYYVQDVGTTLGYTKSSATNAIFRGDNNEVLRVDKSYVAELCVINSKLFNEEYSIVDNTNLSKLFISQLHLISLAQGNELLESDGWEFTWSDVTDEAIGNGHGNKEDDVKSEAVKDEDNPCSRSQVRQRRAAADRGLHYTRTGGEQRQHDATLVTKEDIVFYGHGNKVVNVDADDFAIYTGWVSQTCAVINPEVVKARGIESYGYKNVQFQYTLGKVDLDEVIKFYPGDSHRYALAYHINLHDGIIGYDPHIALGLGIARLPNEYMIHMTDIDEYMLSWRGFQECLRLHTNVPKSMRAHETRRLLEFYKTIQPDINH